MNSFIPEERDDYCDDESISVIIAAYNAEEFLPQAIESILRQTFTKFELIIVNDGSSDRTQEIIEDYMRQDSRIILINSPHFGTSSARNLGIHAAQYSWIAIMDADDISLPDRLAHQYTSSILFPEVTAWGSWVHHIDENGKILSLQKQGAISEFDYIKSVTDGGIPYIVHSSWFIRKETIIKAGMYNEEFSQAQDLELLGRIALQGTVLAIPLPLVQYRIHKTSASVKKFFSQQFYARCAHEQFKYRLWRYPELTIEDFREIERQEIIFCKLNRYRVLLGQYCYKKAGVSYASRCTFKLVLYLVAAIALRPNYAIPRLWRQRFSAEARQEIAKG